MQKSVQGKSSRRVQEKCTTWHILIRTKNYTTAIMNAWLSNSMFYPYSKKKVTNVDVAAVIDFIVIGDYFPPFVN